MRMLQLHGPLLLLSALTACSMSEHAGSTVASPPVPTATETPIRALRLGDHSSRSLAMEASALICGEAEPHLWGQDLCVPVVVVDPSTGAYQTSQDAPATLPALRANTAFDWAGEKWVMVLDPLPADSAARAALLFHEAWHAHQEALGFPANNAIAEHLDETQGRYLMRLEWEALSKALRSSGAERLRHIAQALAFRRERHAAFPKAAEQERAQMRHEGLASYTGVARSGEAVAIALLEIEKGSGRHGLARSFAYASGPAWGLLLDALAPGWRERLKAGGDLPDLAPLGPAALTRPEDYRGAEILVEEVLRAREREAKLASALHATAVERALVLPLTEMNMDFDPERVSTAPDGSSIYERITLGDRWGRIRIDGLALRISPDFSTAFAPWPLPPGTLELAAGWSVQQAGLSANLVRK